MGKNWSEKSYDRFANNLLDLLEKYGVSHPVDVGEYNSESMLEIAINIYEWYVSELNRLDPAIVTEDTYLRLMQHGISSYDLEEDLTPYTELITIQVRIETAIENAKRSQSRAQVASLKEVFFLFDQAAETAYYGHRSKEVESLLVSYG